MCLKGGPRCYTHANQAFQKVAEKHEHAVHELESLNDRRQKMAESTSETVNAKRIGSLDKKIQQAKEKVSILEDKVKTASLERNATPEGLEKLDEKYGIAAYVNAKETPGIVKEYEEAKTAYDEMILRHDRENKTVDTKIPSGYASTLGLEYLQNQKEKNKKSLAKARKANKPKSIERLKNQARLIDEQEKHAHRTLERINSGELDRLDAPPSTILKKSAEYRSYMQSAVHAEQAATIEREYRAIGLRPDGSARVHPKSSHYKEWAAKEKKAYDARMAPRKEFSAPEIPKPDTSKYTKIEQFPLAERRRRLDAGWVDQVDGQEQLF